MFSRGRTTAWEDVVSSVDQYVVEGRAGRITCASASISDAGDRGTKPAIGDLPRRGLQKTADGAKHRGTPAPRSPAGAVPCVTTA
jgi:hypothetical protein